MIHPHVLLFANKSDVHQILGKLTPWHYPILDHGWELRVSFIQYAMYLSLKSKELEIGLS